MSAEGTVPVEERGVRRGTRMLSVALTPEEYAGLAAEIDRLVVAADDADNEVDAVKADNKARLDAAKSRASQIRLSVSTKSRVRREGKVERLVGVTIRTDWRARKTITTRDDTGDVVETCAATAEEWEACGTWETRGTLRVLVAPDGSTMREVALTDAEKQVVLPLAAPPATPGTTRMWIHGGAWRHLDHAESDRLERPDPKGPAVTWSEDGEWFRADVPTVVLSQVEALARKAEVRAFTQPARPTLADLQAQTPEESTRLRPKGRKGVLPPKE